MAGVKTVVQGLQLRQATLEDAKAIAALDVMTNPNPWSLAQIQKYLKPHPSWVMVKGEEVCAFLLTLTNAFEGEVLLIATHPNYRRQGVGRALLNEFLVLCQQRQLEQVMLEVRVTNEAAIALYQSLGFVEISIRKGYYQGVDALMMACPLD